MNLIKCLSCTLNSIIHTTGTECSRNGAIPHAPLDHLMSKTNSNFISILHSLVQITEQKSFMIHVGFGGRDDVEWRLSGRENCSKIGCNHGKRNGEHFSNYFHSILFRTLHWGMYTFTFSYYPIPWKLPLPIHLSKGNKKASKQEYRSIKDILHIICSLRFQTEKLWWKTCFEKWIGSYNESTVKTNFEEIILNSHQWSRLM